MTVIEGRWLGREDYIRLVFYFSILDRLVFPEAESLAKLLRNVAALALASVLCG